MGSGNPPDKPGYKLLKLSGDVDRDELTLNQMVDDGYSIEENQPPQFVAQGYVLLGNYKGSNS